MDMMKKTKKTQEVDTRFHDFCNKISLTDFLNIEKTRIKYFKLFALLFAISVFTWKCIYFLLKRNDGLDNNEVVALILLFFVGIFVLLYPCDKFHSFTKTRFSDFFSSLFGDFRYCKEVSLIAELKKYAPFNFFYRYRIIDALIGSYNDVNIEVADVILQASSRRNVGFSGFVLFLDFKNISSPGIICSSKRRHFIFCVI